MGIWDDLTGKTGADAAKAAAADTYQKQQGAVGKLLGYGDSYKAGMDTNAQAFNPYVQTGRIANEQYQHLMADPSSVRSLPSYQFDQAEGTRAVDRSAAARGMDASGRTLKDLTRFGTGLADRTYGDQLSRLMGGTQLGLGATGAQAGVFGQGLQGQLGARSTAYGGDMTAAGTIGQGDVAAANAKAAGSQNLLNAGLKVAGMVAAPFTGGLSMMPSMMSGGSGGTLTGGYPG